MARIIGIVGIVGVLTNVGEKKPEGRRYRAYPSQWIHHRAHVLKSPFLFIMAFGITSMIPAPGLLVARVCRQKPLFCWQTADRSSLKAVGSSLPTAGNRTSYRRRGIIRQILPGFSTAVPGLNRLS